MRYEVAALFDRPVDGYLTRATTDAGAESVYTETPDSAARRWLWRLTAAERDATVRIVVSAVKGGEYRPFPVYRGVDVEFVRIGGRLEMVEPAERADAAAEGLT